MGTRDTSHSATQRGARAYARAHRQRRRWLAVLGVLAALVVFVTVYALMTPAATLTADSAEEVAETEAVETADESAEEATEQIASAEEETTADETSAEVATTLPDGASVPEGYTQVFTYEDTDQGYAVTAYAAEGVVPEGATLKASLLSEDDEAYATAEEALAADADEDADYGFAALDIRFEDAEGNEVEPTGDVYVVINADALLPEDVDSSTVTVQHLVEDESGTVTSVDAVADAADATDGVVAVTDDTTVQAAFTVDSFSTFTISWSSGSGPNSTTYFTVTVHYVDEEGNEIQGTQTTSLSASVSNNGSETYTFSNYAGTISGYSYSGAHYNSYNGSTVTSMTFSQSGNNAYDRTRTLTFSDGSTTVATLTYNSRTQTVSVYLVYAESDWSIEDNVSSSGVYTVVYTGDENVSTDDYTFVWYRDDGTSTSDTVYPTGEDDWTEVTRTRVSGSMYNLTDDGIALNVALDAELANASGSTRFWYKIEVLDSEGEVVTTLYQKSMYYYELQNGSFENPTINNGQSQNLTDENEYVIWKTTDTQSLIEIIRPYSGTLQTHGVTSAPEGNQIAELNAESEGTLYQDVLTVPGSTLNWQLLHRVRNYAGGTTWYSGYDTMYVVIMSEEMAANVTTQDQVNAIIDAAGFDQDYYYTTTTNGTPEEKVVESGDYAGTVVWRITDYIEGNSSFSTTGWTRYMDSYTVPDGQYLTRFFFASGATSYDNNPNATTSLKFTVGNLLDDVAFTTDILDPDEGQATLSVTKTVSGLDDDDWTDYSVTFDVTDSSNESLGTITISNFTANGDGTYSGTGSLTIDLGSDEATKTVTITETDPAVSGYSVTTEVSGSATADSSNSLKASATLNDGETTSVTYTNTYLKNTESVTIKKTDSDGTPLEGAQFQLYYIDDDDEENYYVESTDGTTVTWTTTPADAATLESETDGTLTFKDLDTTKTYYLVETKAPDGYQLLTDAISIKWDSNGNLVVYKDTTPLGSEYINQETNTITVTNTTGQKLPATGGSGTTMLTAGGVTLIAAAGCGYGLRRRRERRGASR